MEWAKLILDFIGTIVGHLAWPTVVVIAIFVFRQQFQNAIANLAARIGKITVPGLEADFERAGSVRDLTVASKDIEVKDVTPVAVESSSQDALKHNK